MDMITYAGKEIFRAPKSSWVTRFHAFIQFACNDVKFRSTISSITRSSDLAKLNPMSCGLFKLFVTEILDINL